jgi:hypothetical protein
MLSPTCAHRQRTTLGGRLSPLPASLNRCLRKTEQRETTRMWISILSRTARLFAGCRRARCTRPCPRACMQVRSSNRREQHWREHHKEMIILVPSTQERFDLGMMMAVREQLLDAAKPLRRASCKGCLCSRCSSRHAVDSEKAREMCLLKCGSFFRWASSFVGQP